MIRGIDHLVIAWPDPDEAAADPRVRARPGRHRRRPPSGGRIVEPDRVARGRKLPRAHRHRRPGAGAEVAGRCRRAAGAGRPAAASRPTRCSSTTIDLTVQGAPGRRSHLRPADARKPDPRRRRSRRVVGRPSPIGRSPPTAFRSSSSTRTSARSGDPRRSPSAPASSIRIGSPVRLHGLDIATADPRRSAADLHAELQLDFWALGELAVADVGPHVLRRRAARGHRPPGRRQPRRRDRVAANRRCARPALRRRAGRRPRGDAEPTVVPATSGRG